MKCGHRFGDHSQDGELARWELGRDTKWRSSCSKRVLEIKLVFMCLILPTQKFILGKNAKKKKKNDVSQDLMRF